MTRGKRICRILKDIRRQIAENNDIELITSECKHQGDCLGTCPKCEAEVRYLERELEKRQRLGKAITLAGLAVTLSTSAVSCMPIAPESPIITKAQEDKLTKEEIMGDMVPPPPDTVAPGWESMTGLEVDGEMVLPGAMDLPYYSLEYLSSIDSSEVFDILSDFTADYWEEMWRDCVITKTKDMTSFEGPNGFKIDIYYDENYNITGIKASQSKTPTSGTLPAVETTPVKNAAN